MNKTALMLAIKRNSKTYEECADVIGCSLEEFKERASGSVPFGVVEADLLSDFLCLPGEERTYIFFGHDEEEEQKNASEMTNAEYISKINEICIKIDSKAQLQYLYTIVNDIWKDMCGVATAGNNNINDFQNTSVKGVHSTDTLLNNDADAYDAIYTKILDIRNAISNLCCIRVSLHGNDSEVPSEQTLYGAIQSVEFLLENVADEIENKL